MKNIIKLAEYKIEVDKKKHVVILETVARVNNLLELIRRLK